MFEKKVRCTSCGYENEKGAKFCKRCGVALPQKESRIKRLRNRLSEQIREHYKEEKEIAEKRAASKWRAKILGESYRQKQLKKAEKYGKIAEKGLLYKRKERKEKGQTLLDKYRLWRIGRLKEKQEMYETKAEKRLLFKKKRAEYIGRAALLGEKIKKKEEKLAKPAEVTPQPAPKKLVCPYCGTEYEEGAEFCPFCREKIKAALQEQKPKNKFCRFCGARITRPKAKYCRKCGSKL